MERIKKLRTSLNISDIQNEAQSIPAINLLCIKNNDIYAMDSYERTVRGLYSSFLAELKMSDIADFDCDFLPFNVNDCSINSFDVTKVTVSDFLNLIEKAKQLEDSQGTKKYKGCTSWRALVELSNILRRASIMVVDNQCKYAGHYAEQRDCYKLLFMSVDDFLELYKENLTMVYDDPSEVLLRLSDVPKIQRWVFDKSTLSLISSGMPVESMIASLVDNAKKVDYGTIDSKDSQSIYKLLYAIVFNLFGYFKDICNI